MIRAAHVLLYTSDAEADRAFLRDQLGLRHIDVGGGWLIFELPPAELGVHPAEAQPAEDDSEHGKMAHGGLFFVCDDINQTIAELAAKGVSVSTPQEADWGIFTSIRLPSGAHLGLYEPKHAMAV